MPSAVRKAFKSVLSRLLKPVARWYLSSDRNYVYKGVRATILKGVFHPGLFFSTKILLSYLEGFELKGKSLLELGAGTGLIAVYSAGRGADVTASDISLKAMENIKLNAEENKAAIKIIHSDVFEKFPESKFDFIVINPPYYKKNPLIESEFAWYCGEQLEYFEKLFKQLKTFIHAQSHIIMVLSEDCDETGIRMIADKNNFHLDLKRKFYRMLEKNFVFEVFEK